MIYVCLKIADFFCFGIYTRLSIFGKSESHKNEKCFAVAGLTLSIYFVKICLCEPLNILKLKFKI